MSGNPNPKAEVQTHLHAIAQLLRQADRLTPEAQQLLAELVDELGDALDSPDVPDQDVAGLTESAAQLVQAVQEKHEPGLLAAAEDRLESAVVAIESKAPALANLTRQLAELLANIGI
jgi:hypothetical protein